MREKCSIGVTENPVTGKGVASVPNSAESEIHLPEHDLAEESDAVVVGISDEDDAL